MTRDQLREEIRIPLTALPHHLRESLANYLVDGTPTGGFLRACLANDLRQAVLRADPVSFADLRAIVLLIVNYAPIQSAGSYAMIDNWAGLPA